MTTDLISSKQYSDDNYILKYWQQIESGRITVSRRIRKLYKKLVADIITPRANWVFDLEKAIRPILFTETYCKHSKGKWARQPVMLELWEKALMQAIFGFVDKDTGKRKHTKAILFVARKNGKSLIASCIALYMLTKDGEGGAECYSIATKKDQAKIVWLEAKRMIAKSPALRKRLKTLVSEIRYDATDSVFKPLGSDSDTLDGLNPSLVCVDELHAISDKNVVDVMADGMTAREQPLLLETTTMGTLRDNIFDIEYEDACKIIDAYEDENSDFVDDQLIAFVYELDERDEWTKPECWRKANPGLGTIKDESKLAEKVARAKRRPSDVANLLCKDFNVRSTTAGSWLTFEEANNKETFKMSEIENSYCIGGGDLAATTDLTCASLIVMKPNSDKVYLLQHYFMPGATIEERSKEDKVPYDKWADRGLLTACNDAEGNPASQVSYADITAWYVKMRDEHKLYALWIYYDRALAGYWVEDMQNNGFKMVKCAQGALTFSAPMRMMESDLRAKKLIYNDNPIFKWCLTNTATKTDDNENIRPVKGKNRRQRVDGTFSCLDAYVGLAEHKTDYLNML